jgi:hypothetical protein
MDLGKLVNFSTDVGQHLDEYEWSWNMGELDED